MTISINKILIFFLLAAGLTACSESIRVMHVNKVAETDHAIVYNLPQTAILVEVEVEKTVNFKGPFAEYTDLYFQSNRTVMRNETFYRLKNVNISSFPVPDSAQYYAVLPAEESTTGSFLSLNEYQFPVGIRTQTNWPTQQFSETLNIRNTEPRGPDYADLSVKSVRETVYDTVYTEVFRDSVFVKVPKVYTRKQFKSPEKQAKEMAEQIFRLRDDRLALIKGVTDANNFPDGDAVKLMIDELNKYERQYMNMFTGQTHKSSESYRFVWLPNDELSDTGEILFRFSEKFGILPSDINQGKPFRLQLVKSRHLADVGDYLQYTDTKRKQKKEDACGFAYRIPGRAHISLHLENQLLLERDIFVAQYGEINRLPTDILTDPAVEIIFYTELGALKRISPLTQHSEKK